MSDAPNPLFGNFQPQPIEPVLPVKENPFTGETSGKKPRKPKKPKAVAAAKPKKPRTPRKPKATSFTQTATVKPVEPPMTNLQALFAAMKGLENDDHALFEKLLAASSASRKRVFTAIAKIFP